MNAVPSDEPNPPASPNAQSLHTAAPFIQPSVPADDGVSAWLDGEADDVQWAALWTESARQDTLATWHRYHVIGDVLRASAPALGQQAPQDFLAAVRAGLPAHPPLQVVQPEATSVASSAPALAVPRPDAANDAVFRWKWVAGVASLSAVLAVAWSVLGTAAPEAVGNNLPAGQWAVQNPSPVEPGATTILVNDPQGLVMRDLQLERLMAEHRQYGAVSALQVPAGFVRNATYDVSGR
ncbi:MAG: hypothetical protein RLZZ352_751 [Pseudomonadota bacterium]|jgi:sigma-E factor negative regulatory protein RseA